MSYYHGLVRKYIILFGSLLTQIYIDRVDDANQVQKTLKVPLSYGPKEWYLARYYENPDLTRQISSVLPRMTFEIVGFRYANERKKNTTNSYRQPNAIAGVANKMNEGVPWDMHIRLSVLTRNADDGTRIIEQILPKFTPELTLTLKSIPEMDFEQNVPVILQNVALDDTYNGPQKTEDRAVVWNLDFVLKGQFFGPVTQQGVIKEINVNMFGDMIGLDLLDRVYIRPGLTIDGQPATSAAESIPVDQIQVSDNWSYLVEFLGGGQFAYTRDDGTKAKPPTDAGPVYVVQPTQYTTLQFIIDGVDLPIAAGVKGDMLIPFPCTIQSVSMIADVVGNVHVDIWKSSFEAISPTVPGSANTIVGTTPLAITNDIKYQDNSLIGWNTQIATDDVLRFNVVSCDNIQRVTIAMKVIKN